jgi:hypothetical protein
LLHTVEMALCDACLAPLRVFGPTQNIGYRGARASEPIALAVVLRELERAAGRRRRQRKATMHRVAQSPLDEAFMERITSASRTEEVARLVRNHPALPGLLASNAEANSAYYLHGGGGTVAAQHAERQLDVLRATAKMLAMIQTLDRETLDSL